MEALSFLMLKIVFPFSPFEFSALVSFGAFDSLTETQAPGAKLLSGGDGCCTGGIWDSFRARLEALAVLLNSSRDTLQGRVASSEMFWSSGSGKRTINGSLEGTGRVRDPAMS